jgi:hypothetical protein
MTSLVAPKTIIELSVVTAAHLVAISLIGDGKFHVVNAQVVDVDEPPTNATEELDVKIDAAEPLPANGTIVVDISDTDDVDIDTIPPADVSVIVTNTTVTVTNNPVEISEETSGTSFSDTEGSSTETPTDNGVNEEAKSSDSNENSNDEDSADDNASDAAVTK